MSETEASDKSPDQDAALQPVESPKLSNNNTAKKPNIQAPQKYLPLSWEHCKYCGTSTRLKEAYVKLLVHSSREKCGADCYRSSNIFTQNSVKGWAFSELLRFNQLISMQKAIRQDSIADGMPEKGEDEEECLYCDTKTLGGMLYRLLLSFRSKDKEDSHCAGCKKAYPIERVKGSSWKHKMRFALTGKVDSEVRVFQRAMADEILNILERFWDTLRKCEKDCEKNCEEGCEVDRKRDCQYDWRKETYSLGLKEPEKL